VLPTLRTSVTYIYNIRHRASSTGACIRLVACSVLLGLIGISIKGDPAPLAQPWLRRPQTFLRPSRPHVLDKFAHPGALGRSWSPSRRQLSETWPEMYHKANPESKTTQDNPNLLKLHARMTIRSTQEFKRNYILGALLFFDHDRVESYATIRQ
jgi:hypothetical protein